MMEIPAPQVSQGARLIVTIVVWWSVIIGIVCLMVCAAVYANTAPPTALPVCIVAPGVECPVAARSGSYTAYYIEWSGSVGLASSTPRPGGTP